MGGVNLKVIIILRKSSISHPKTNNITISFTPPIADGMAVCSISFLTRAGMCAPGRGTSTRLCRYLKRENRNSSCLLVFSKVRLPFIAISGQPVLIEPHTCMHPCPDGKTHQTTTRSNVDGRIIEPFMIPPRPPISMLIVGEGCPKRASATELWKFGAWGVNTF